MISRFRSLMALVVLLSGGLLQGIIQPASAGDAMQIDADVRAALDTLYAKEPTAKTVAEHAKAILVFPKIAKAGFVVGAQYGDGAMLQNGAITGYYNISAVSYGLQAGLQSFGYAMFLMTDEVLQNFMNSAGFEVGVGPSIVLLDKGTGKNLTTTTMKAGIYAAVFGQKGLMAGTGLQGSKITRLKN